MGISKRTLWFVAVAVVAAAAGATVWAQVGATGRANLHPANQSGIMGRITFMQTPGGVVATGTAKGLAPNTGPGKPAGVRYVSLVYDVGSVPGGPTVCEPVDPFPNMFLGIWTSDAAGNGILIQTGSIPPLGGFDTVSIRDTTITSGGGPGFGPQAVVACGQVAVNP